MRVFLLSILTFLILSTSTVAWFFLSMPNPDTITECLTTEMFQVELCEKNKTYTRINNISKYMKEIVVISEDSSFYQHDGFDWFEMENSFRTNWREKAFARGGSTITQQLVKNVFLTASKNPIRKLKEAYLAYRIEQILDKKQILEKYLNVIEFGPGIFGINKASWHYFNKPPVSLNLLESAFLTYLLPNPKAYSKVYNKGSLTDFSRRRLQDLCYKMYRFGRIQESQYMAAKEMINSFPWKSLDGEQIAALNGESSFQPDEELPENLEEMLAKPIEGEQEHLDRELSPEEEIELENSMLDN